ELGIFCRPVFSGNNGGATAQGVTKDRVEVIWFEGSENATENAVLSRGGLETTPQQRDGAIQAFVDFANTHWELYGRKIHVTRFAGNCPTAPQDHDSCLASAQEVVRLHPFAVIWASAFYADAFDVWANAGIPSFGGNWWDTTYYGSHRPYRWDYYSSGSEVMDLTAEYYCKNMFGRPADHAGTVIHPTIGGRSTPRHLGIATSDERELAVDGQHLRDAVRACTGGKDVPTVIAVSNDLSQASTTLSALTAKLINEKVTTFVCACEAISTAIVSNAFTQEHYFPEWLIPPSGGMDADPTGRLADVQQWAHVMGLGQSWEVPLAQSPATTAWRATGRSGLPCGALDCGSIFTYLSLVGMGIELAGPNLNATTMEHGLKTAVDTSPAGSTHGHWSLAGPRYNLLDDVRAVRWDANATSKVDGKQGAYLALSGGRRFRIGEVPGGLLAQVPVSSQ